MTLPANVLDLYYEKVPTRDLHDEIAYQTRILKCSMCEHVIHLRDAPKRCEYGDSNLGKVARLRGAMRDHLRDKHALKIALLEAEKSLAGSAPPGDDKAGGKMST